MRIALALALLGSLAINAWLLMRPDPPTATPATADLKTCEATLATCEARRAQEPPRTATAVPSPPAAVVPFEVPRALLPSTLPVKPPSAGGVVSELTPDLQQDMLSQVAREKLRDEWKRQEPSMLKGLRASLSDGPKQLEDAQKEGKHLSTEAGLDPALADRFTQAYEAARLKRMSALLADIAGDPPDWAKATDEARGLFADEDALMAQIGGDAAKKRLRAAQAEGRTVILAIGASLSDQPWEQAVHW